MEKEDKEREDDDNDDMMMIWWYDDDMMIWWYDDSVSVWGWWWLVLCQPIVLLFVVVFSPVIKFSIIVDGIRFFGFILILCAQSKTEESIEVGVNPRIIHGGEEKQARKTWNVKPECTALKVMIRGLYGFKSNWISFTLHEVISLRNICSSYKDKRKEEIEFFLEASL